MASAVSTGPSAEATYFEQRTRVLQLTPKRLAKLKLRLEHERGYRCIAPSLKSVDCYIQYLALKEDSQLTELLSEVTRYLTLAAPPDPDVLSHALLPDVPTVPSKSAIWRPTSRSKKTVSFSEDVSAVIYILPEESRLSRPTPSPYDRTQEREKYTRGAKKARQQWRLLELEKRGIPVYWKALPSATYPSLSSQSGGSLSVDASSSSVELPPTITPE